jgi:hypothetical protein
MTSRSPANTPLGPLYAAAAGACPHRPIRDTKAQVTASSPRSNPADGHRVLQHVTQPPTKIGDIARAALVLTHFEHGYLSR